jgi:Protein of unknown function (DUF2892)
MKFNVGHTDRAIRVVAGVAILCLFFVLEGNARWLALLGIVPLTTGLIRWCPAYSLVGLTTSKRTSTTL